VRRLVDYRVGPAPGRAAPSGPGPCHPRFELGRDSDRSVITLITWRSTSATNESWARTYHAFRTEVHLIKARVEGLL
jgi:hypothetical protein